jgi:hypothetical protein
MVVLTGNTSVADPDPGSGEVLTTRGWKKSGTRIRVQKKHLGSFFQEHSKKFLELKILIFFVADPDPGSDAFLTRDPGWKSLDPG